MAMGERSKEEHRRQVIPSALHFEGRGHEMALEDFLDNWKPRWQTKRIEGSAVTAPSSTFGIEDGVVEWLGPRPPVELFTEIEAATLIRRKEFLFLIGRKGTGKTTLINAFCRLVNSGDHSSLRYAVLSDSHRSLLKVASFAQSTSVSLLTIEHRIEVLRPVWRWLAAFEAMRAIVRSERVASSDIADSRVLEAYVTLYERAVFSDPGKSLAQSLEGRFADLRRRPSLSSDSPGEEIETELFDTLFEEAFVALRRIAQRSGILVFFDTGEYYTLNEDASLAAVSAMLAEVYDVTLGGMCPGLVLKAAVPAEVVPRIRLPNAGKFANRGVTIAWSHDDLARFAAKRIAGATGIENPARIVSLKHSLEILAHVFPRTIVSRNGVTLGALAYFIRHTHKTPRQLLLLLNGAIAYARSSERRKDTWTHEEGLLRDGIHQQLSSVVEDAIDMYRSSFDDLPRLLHSSLARSHSIGRATEYLSLLRRSGAGKLSEGGDWEHLLLEFLIRMGVLGLVSSADYRNIGDRSMWMVGAQFEYQLKESLRVSDLDTLAVHPMFYQWLGCNVDENSFVYPRASSQDEVEYGGLGT
jgi:hypothetical protein